MKSLRERYFTDPLFSSLVDTMVAQIQRGGFTPSEMREAALLASIIYEESHIREMKYIESDVEEALRLLRSRIEQNT